MIQPIGAILNSKLSTLTWLERRGGVVVNAVRPAFVTGADGAQIRTGEEVYPVACGTSDEACWNGGKYKFFTPDSGVSAVSFFRDSGGVSFQSALQDNARHRYAFELQFLCWLNLKKLGVTDCDFTAQVVPYVIAKLWGDHSATGVFDDGIEEDIYQQITVNRIRQLPKSPSVFQPYTFAANGERRGLFLYPYDYFALAISGTFDININCLPTLTLPGAGLDCFPE